MQFVALAAIGLYLFSAICLFKQRRNHSQPYYLYLSSAIALTLHCTLVFFSSVIDGAINLSFFSASNIISAFIIAMALGISCILPVFKVIAPLFILAAINIAASLVFNNTSSIALNPHVAVHVVSSLLAYSVFSLATANACIIWFQNNAFKTHQLDKLIFELPSLEILERMLFQMLIVGFVLLSISIAGGFLYIDDFFGQKLAHKSVFSVLSWLTFAVLLTGRFILGWRGTLAVKWTIGGFAFLMLGYFGSKFVLELLLHR